MFFTFFKLYKWYQIAERIKINWPAICFHDIAKYLKKNHRTILLTECTLDINRNKHIVALHVSLFKPFFIAKFQHLSVLFYVYLVWIIATKNKS